MELKEDGKSEESFEYSVKNQYYASVIVNLLILSFGIHQGWCSPAINLLVSDSSPLPSGRMTMEEASWAASLEPAGALFGNIFIGYVTKHFGRKKPLHFITIPMVCGWLLIRFAQSPVYFYIGRFIGGLFGSCAFTVLIMFQSEIANDRVRGALVSTLGFSICVGYLLAYIIGSLNYYAMADVSIALIAIFAGLMFILPETPLYLVKEEQLAAAEKSICFYKNICKKSDDCDKLLRQEITKLQAIIVDDDQHAHNIKTSLKWSDFTTKTARKALALGIILIGLFVWNGIYGTSAYAANIFERTGSPLSPNDSVIVLGVMQMIGVCISVALVDRFGRKPLLAVSGAGTTLGYVVFGIYMMLKSWDWNIENTNWIPLASLSWVSFISVVGILILPVSILPEIMPEHIKEIAVGFCMSFNWISAFINMKYAPLLMETIGLDFYSFVFAAICLACTIIILIFLPETKNKSHEEIMEMLSS